MELPTLPSSEKMKAIAIAGLVGLGLVLSPSAAFAETSVVDDAIIELAPGVPQQSTEAIERIDAALEDLSGTQSQEEIDALAELSGTTVLWDPDTGEDLAAVRVVTAQPFAIGVVGPGCSGSSMCLTTSNGTPNGYTGSGVRTINLNSVVRAYAGDRIGSLTPSSGAIKVLKKGVTVSFSSARKVVTITRG